MTNAGRRRPNILFITADQQRADCFGFAGRKVRTPHLDQLARDGSRFSACITPNVVCQPARASILTGLLPMTHGVHDNGIDLDPAVGEKGFAGALAAAGYDTAFIGKAHFSTYHTFEPTGTPECIRSSAGYGDDWFGPYMGFEHVELMLLGHNWWDPAAPPQGLHYERWYHADGRGSEKNALYRDGYPGTHAAQTWDCKLPVAWHNSTWVGDRTVDFIHGKTERPWCLWASFPDPHHPFDAPEPWCYLHDPDAVDLPEHRTRDLDRRPWWHRPVLERKIEGQFGDVRMSYSRIPPQSDDQLRHIIANTYGMIALIDHNVGRILIALEEAGLTEDTIVVYSVDHGDWLGDHGLILKGPMFYEGLLRVPLIVRGPGIAADSDIATPVSTLDLAATFLDWAGAPATGAMHSRSLVPLMNGGGSRDFAYNEWELHPNRAGVPLSLRCVRTRTHKLTFEQTSGEGELYDLANDPDEMENRWNDPSAAKMQNELMDMIRSRPADTIGRLNAPVGAA
jgi:arylsulfatase A-like enzyme